jgi:mono/diheme cytochrome c family protein
MLSAAISHAQSAPDAFAKTIQPFVAKYCISCHGAKKQSGELNLEIAKDVTAIANNLAGWEEVKKRLVAREMPPKNKPQPTEAERTAFLASLDAELTKAAGPPNPGRVTLRRLNRDEYNRTIRDLTGVSFRPADDFPSDDVGHGFDNIGDVLSMPPIMLEKYLAAADQILQRVFDGEVQTPVIRKVAAKDLQSTVKGELITLRNGESARTLAIAGEIHATVQISRPGELIFRPKLYGRPPNRDAGANPVRVSIRVDGKEIRTQSVRFPTPTLVEAKVKVNAGSHRLSVALLNPSEKDTPREQQRVLGIAAFEYEEPPEPNRPTTGHRKIMGDDTTQTRDRAKAIIGTFAKRAYRRPVTGHEIERLLKLYDTARDQNDSFEAGVRLALQAVLVSPHFLFRVEVNRPADRADGSYALNDWEFASRLSYFLWSTMPDDELFALAERGELAKPAVRKAQTLRMLRDPRAYALAENFADQWLNTRILQTVQPSRRDYPEWDELLRKAMMKETEMFFDGIRREDRSILEFIDANYTYLNDRLARHYGIADVRGSEFRKITLTDRNRGGVITQASVLTVTSNPTRTSPVKRGKWILENLFNDPPPPPDPNAGMLPDDSGKPLSGTLRQRMEQHRANPNCATCHVKMDQLGFGLENFDPIGKWRTKDGSHSIDSAGVLPDKRSFSGPGELKKILLADAEPFRRCLTEKMLTYALGRGLTPSDRSAVHAISKAVEIEENRFSALVLGIVESDAFRRRVQKK